MKNVLSIKKHNSMSDVLIPRVNMYSLNRIRFAFANIYV